MFSSTFSNKIFLITGASSGIGKELSIFLSKLGATLIITARDKSRLNETFNLLNGKGHRQFSVDISIPRKISNLMNNIYSECGQLDGLVHCAGQHHTIPVQMISEESYDKLFNINTKSALFLAKAFRKKGRCNPNGASIIFLSSAAALSGEAGISEYSASKLALEGFARSLASELSKQKIRVNCIAPGVVRTEMTENSLYALTPEQFLKIQNRHLLGIGKIEDVIGPIVFLLSDYARWITGVNLSVDGGYTLG